MSDLSGDSYTDNRHKALPDWYDRPQTRRKPMSLFTRLIGRFVLYWF